jgi:hypothetical protein
MHNLGNLATQITSTTARPDDGGNGQGNLGGQAVTISGNR